MQKVVELVGCGVAYTIRDLARQLRLSPSYLQRLFKQETGVLLGEWLTEQRLQRAAHLLPHLVTWEVFFKESEGTRWVR
ncbi:MAG: helix-turn-helix domain-containing protein [Bryobacteraceae bacterium]